MIFSDLSLLKRVAMARHLGKGPMGGILVEPDGGICRVIASNGLLIAWGQTRVDCERGWSPVLIPRAMAACLEKAKTAPGSYLKIRRAGLHWEFRLHLCDGRPDLVLETINEAPLYPTWRKAFYLSGWAHRPELYYQQRLTNLANEILAEHSDLEAVDFREMALTDKSLAFSVACRNGVYVAIAAKRYAEFHGPEETIPRETITEELEALRGGQ